jgi:hypothetical protein
LNYYDLFFSRELPEELILMLEVVVRSNRRQTWLKDAMIEARRAGIGNAKQAEAWDKLLAIFYGE